MTWINRRHLLIGGGATLALAGGSALWWRGASGSMTAYDAYAADLRAPPSDPALGGLVRYAALAANGHNTQPWRFRVAANRIDILPDLERRTPVVDPDDHHLFVSLGCAAENLAIAASAAGWTCETVEPRDGAALSFTLAHAAPVADPLFDAIPRRQSTRAVYDGRAVSPADLETLAKAGSEDGVTLVLLTERSRLNAVRDLIVTGNDRQMRDRAFVAELKDWLRFSARSAMQRGEGLFAAASGNPVMPDAIGRLAFDLFVGPASENDKAARQVDSSPGLAIFVGDTADPAHWMKVGRACQRFALQATALGLKLAFLNQPVEVADLRPQLAALVGMPGRRPDLVLRFGYGPTMPYSPRRPVKAILA
jgi:hypothetical protein